MHVESHNKLSEIKRFRATCVIIRDDVGNPIAIAAQIGTDAYVTSTVGQSDFEALLRNLDIPNTTIVSTVQHKPASQLQFL